MLLKQLFGVVSVAQLVASMSGVVLGGVVEVVGSHLVRGEMVTASIGSAFLLEISYNLSSDTISSDKRPIDVWDTIFTL